MMNGLFVIGSFISVFLLPWPLTALIVIAGSFFEPLVPLAIGLFADTLFYTPQTEAFPLFTLGGAAVTALVLFVRSRLNTSPVRDL